MTDKYLKASRSWWSPARPIDQVRDTIRWVGKGLFRQPLARLTLAGPRTARFVARELNHVRPFGKPKTRLTPGLIGQIALDESIMALAVSPSRFPSRLDYSRVGDELAIADTLFNQNGWYENPHSYHQNPPLLEDPSIARGWALGQSYERILWPSDYVAHDNIPGAERWGDFKENHTASAWILRHTDRPRPWIVCIHGFGTGSTFMDLFTFRAMRLHRDFGVNIAALVMPVHGHRKPTLISGEELLGFNFMNGIHGLTQSVWDTRRLLSWVRSQSPTGIGVFGISLGGLVAALLTSFESDLDLTIAGIPVVNLCGLIEHHIPSNLQKRSIEHGILDGTGQRVHRVISPLHMKPLAPNGNRLIFAGLGDRLVPTVQAQQLATHWDPTEVKWFAGNHVGYLWSDTVWCSIAEALSNSNLIDSDNADAVIKRLGHRRISR